MTPFLVALCFVVGLPIGSFLNVVVWRVPRGESVVSPPSACPRCGHVIRARDNVPVLGWVLLRGRCRDCGNPISVRYPLVEAATAVLFGLTAWWTGWDWVLPALLFLGAIGIALALIDIDVHRLPDAIVLPAYPVALVLLTLATWSFGHESDWPALGRAAIGAVALAAVYFATVLVHPAGMGLGDVKLAGLLGLYLGWFGWGALLIGWFAAYLLGGIYAIALVVLRGAGRKSKVPFGPWMLLGAAVGIVAGEAIWSAYLHAFS